MNLEHRLPIKEDPAASDNIVRFIDSAGNSFTVDTSKGEKPPLLVRVTAVEIVVSTRVYDKLKREEEKRRNDSKRSK